MPVYFAQAVEGGPIKIGVSRHVKHRVHTLASNAGKPFRVLAVIEGDRETEQKLHKRFANLLIKGRDDNGREWFSPGQDLLDYIASEGIPSDFIYEPGWWTETKKRRASYPTHKTIPIYALPEWRAWATRLAQSEGMSLSELVVMVVVEYAARRQFEPGPTARLPFDWTSHRPKGEIAIND